MFQDFWMQQEDRPTGTQSSQGPTMTGCWRASTWLRAAFGIGLSIATMLAPRPAMGVDLRVEASIAVGYDRNLIMETGCQRLGPGRLGFRARLGARISRFVGVGFRGGYAVSPTQLCDGPIELLTSRTLFGADLQFHPLAGFDGPNRGPRRFDFYLGVGIDVLARDVADGFFEDNRALDPNLQRGPSLHRVVRTGVGVPLQLGFEYSPVQQFSIGFLLEASAFVRPIARRIPVPTSTWADDPVSAFNPSEPVLFGGIQFTIRP